MLLAFRGSYNSLAPPLQFLEGKLAEILNSWKQIASYVGRGVRTVQRWEHDLGFPVRRPWGRSRSTVIAFSSEIDTWLKATPLIKERKNAAKQEEASTPVALRERLLLLHEAYRTAGLSLAADLRQIEELPSKRRVLSSASRRKAAARG